MDPIDKIIVRYIIIILGGIFGWTSVKNAATLDAIAKNTGAKSSYNAGPVPLPERQK